MRLKLDEHEFNLIVVAVRTYIKLMPAIIEDEIDSELLEEIVSSLGRKLNTAKENYLEEDD